MASAVGASALTVKRNVEALTPKRLRGVGKKGARIGVKYDIKGFGNPTALVRAYGPFHLYERDVKRHQVGVRAKAGLMTLPGDSQAAYGPFMAGGSKGKHSWEKGVAMSIPISRQVFRRALSASLRSSFGF